MNATAPRSVPLEPLTRAVNALIEFDPDTRRRLASLAGRVVAVELLEIGKVFYLLPRAEGIDIAVSTSRPVDVRISARPFDLIAHLRARDAPALPGRVAIQGDLAVAQTLQAIGSRIDIDWEEFAARFVGDIAARQLGRAVRALSAGLRHARTAFADNVAEYAQYEAQLLAIAPEVERFSAEVDAIRADADKLEVRIARLAARRRTPP